MNKEVFVVTSLILKDESSENIVLGVFSSYENAKRNLINNVNLKFKKYKDAEIIDIAENEVKLRLTNEKNIKCFESLAIECHTIQNN